MAQHESWQRREHEEIVTGNASLLGENHLLVAMTRMRNEALILPDTLDYLSGQVDAIIAYDDASTDDTLAILRAHPKVALIVANKAWEKNVDARKAAEARHRGLLLDLARERLPHDWTFCFDPDERVAGDLRAFVRDAPQACGGVRVRLFDAYLTPDDHAPYTSDAALMNFRRFYGPEQRDILMLWRNVPQVHFVDGGGRTPQGIAHIETHLYCQHYGKSLSVAHWEETCDYYIAHFPYDTYGKKWEARKGKAIHTQSDFGRPLYAWGDPLFANAVPM